MMDQIALNYWSEYWEGREQPQSVSAYPFRAEPDYIAQLVVDGVKTATCSGYMFYEMDNEPLPTTEDYSIILDSNDEPVAIIKTVEVMITPMNEVTESFAFAEGEGDRSYRLRIFRGHAPRL